METETEKTVTEVNESAQPITTNNLESNDDKNSLEGIHTNEKKANSNSHAEPIDQAKTSENAKEVSPKRPAPSPKSKNSTPKGKAKVDKTDESDEKDTSEDEDKPKRLFEEPLVIEDGRKRQRKQVERLSTLIDKDFAKSNEKRKIVVPDGRGTPLGEIPYCEYQLKRSKPADLKLMHHVAFGRDGAVAEIRTNLRQFKGFDFNETSSEYTKKLEYLKTKHIADLKEPLRIVGLELSGHKDELSARIMDFMMKPHDVGKKVPETAKKSRKKKKTARSTSSHGKATATSESVSGEEEDEDKISTESNESEVSSPESAGSEDTPKKKKRKPSTKATPAKKTPVKTPSRVDKPKTSKKRAAPSRSSSASPPSKEARLDNSETKEEASDLPSDEELKSKVKELLKDANLHEITMKTVIEQVFNAFPGKDLVSKRSFIKDTVKEALH